LTIIINVPGLTPAGKEYWYCYHYNYCQMVVIGMSVLFPFLKNISKDDMLYVWPHGGYCCWKKTYIC